jgi:hypothetical protein
LTSATVTGRTQRLHGEGLRQRDHTVDRHSIVVHGLGIQHESNDPDRDDKHEREGARSTTTGGAARGWTGSWSTALMITSSNMTNQEI